jgi:hypothetical protein
LLHKHSSRLVQGVFNASSFLRRLFSWQHGELHVHAFVVFTANHSADHYIFPRVGRGRKSKLLQPWLKQQIPSLNLGSILGSEQGEAVDRSVSIPRFAPASGYSQNYWLSSLDRYLGSAFAGDLISAVAVGKNLDDMNLWRSGLGARARRSINKKAPHND